MEGEKKMLILNLLVSFGMAYTLDNVLYTFCEPNVVLSPLVNLLDIVVFIVTMLVLTAINLVSLHRSDGIKVVLNFKDTDVNKESTKP